jgi:hypothetical protein
MSKSQKLERVSLVWIECGSRMREIIEISLDPYCKHNSVFPKLLQFNVAYVAHS